MTNKQKKAKEKISFFKKELRHLLKRKFSIALLRTEKMQRFLAKIEKIESVLFEAKVDYKNKRYAEALIALNKCDELFSSILADLNFLN